MPKIKTVTDKKFGRKYYQICMSELDKAIDDIGTLDFGVASSSEVKDALLRHIENLIKSILSDMGIKQKFGAKVKE